MEATKFHELCEAFGKAQSEFGSFQNEWHFISVSLVKELKKYF